MGPIPILLSNSAVAWNTNGRQSWEKHSGSQWRMKNTADHFQSPITRLLLLFDLQSGSTEDPAHRPVFISLDCPKQSSFSPGIFVKNNQAVKNSHSFNITGPEAIGNSWSKQ